MTAHHSLTDADVDAIEARAALDGPWINVRWVAEALATLCAEVRRLRAALAAACFPASECERCAALAERLEDRRVMARQVLETEGLGHVAALIPIEEVQEWVRGQ